MTIDYCATPELKPFDEALTEILNSVPKITQTEIIPLEKSLGRVLASDIQSSAPMPPWDCSAMDGYAFHDSSLNSTNNLSLIGVALAGHPFKGEVSKGQCIRIMTGACLPDDCNTVVMQEHVQVKENIITFNDYAKPGDNVRKTGADVSTGENIFSAGQTVNATNIGVFATLGLAEVSVFRKLKVAIFSTGDELVAVTEQLQQGQIYDSNRLGIIALCSTLGFEIIDLGLIADDPEKIKQAITGASTKVDAIITSGGVSVGEADYVKPVVEEIGTIDLWKVAIKPGKPIAIGTIDRAGSTGTCKFFGLPGNPVSAMVTFNLLVQPALQMMSGMDPDSPLTCSAISDSLLKKKPGRRDYQRGFAYPDEQGLWHVKSTGTQGSAKLTSLCSGNCYIVLKESAGNVSVGDNVNIQFFDKVFR